MTAWPGGARAACAFTFDLDAESLWLGRGVTERVALSQGTFGVLEGLPRILELLSGAGPRGRRADGLSASFFVPAWVIERYPDAIDRIVAAGHEVGCHGDVHERVSELDAVREEAILVKSIAAVARHAGRPRGYRSPSWQLSDATLGLLARHGFEYSSNMMDRLRPYLHAPSDGRRLVELPVSWVLDDAPYFMFTGQRSIQPPRPVLEGWLAEFDGIAAQGGLATFTFHPQIIGRPSRLACLGELIDHVQATPGVWVTRLDAIAAHWRTTAREGAETTAGA